MTSVKCMGVADVRRPNGTLIRRVKVEARLNTDGLTWEGGRTSIVCLAKVIRYEIDSECFPFAESGQRSARRMVGARPKDGLNSIPVCFDTADIEEALRAPVEPCWDSRRSAEPSGPPPPDLSERPTV